MVEVIPDSYVECLDLLQIFGRDAPLQVDLGCGDGSFLLDLAGRMPHVNFLGIERLAGRVEKARRKAERIDNVRVLRMETSYAVRYMLPPHSVDVFHLLFPDPWPKRRHHRRRIVTEDFLKAIDHALIPNGKLRVVTDQADYFEKICLVAQPSKTFAVLKLSGGNDFPSSTFEKRFKSQGVEIYRVELRKISPVI